MEGKPVQILQVCHEKTGWNLEVSSTTRRDWLKWRNQLWKVKVPRSILYWICNRAKDWKDFISNRVSDIGEITRETGIVWRHCPTDKNLADLGNHCASIDKMQKGQWFEGPEWLVNKEEWPVQPKLERMQSVLEEHKPKKEEVL